MNEIPADNGVEVGFLARNRAEPFGCWAARHLTEGLRLAAAPSFAVMALLAGLVGEGGPTEVLCLGADHASPFGGMVAMYLLMSAFHLPPWLKLLCGQGNGAGR